MEKHLMKSNDKLLEQIDKIQKQNEAYAQELHLLREQVAYLTTKLFGRSTEKSEDLNGQLDLFNDDKLFNQAETTEEKTIVEEIKYKRKKQIGYKAALTKDLPVKEVYCELTNQDCQCDWWMSHMKPIGKEYVREEVVFSPATMYKKKYYRYAYACPNCKTDGADYIKKATVPASPIKHSLASPSVLSHLLHQKFEMSLPFYRQEKEWEGYGLSIPRRTLANWVITISENWLLPIWETLKDCLLQEEILRADETPYKVLSSNKSKTYYWLFRTIEKTDHPIILFKYEETRSGAVPQKFLHDFHGFLHCDAYGAYGTLKNVTLVNCWAHLRRKFFEAKATTAKTSKAQEGIVFCDKLFKLEREFEQLVPHEKYRERQLKSKPLLDEFWNWLGSFPTLNGSKLGKAVDYALNNKNGLMNFLLDGRCAISNNVAERNIRTTTIGRKNWNFSTSKKGAEANGIVYSLIETAKANGINPQKYFEFLFEKLPNLTDNLSSSVLEDYLPWANQIQMNCK
ncbi:IS66 family transposase [Enterococcus faecalis]|uniref:IS66 family transposase n=1 Tax=Enterococcus faecalis TaxID=1351 RepID=UPI0022E291AF|nr:IS66 family transposase [Enterococcus faecalis]